MPRKVLKRVRRRVADESTMMNEAHLEGGGDWRRDGDDDNDNDDMLLKFARAVLESFGCISKRGVGSGDDELAHAMQGHVAPVVFV
ncbi:hypothetical protein ACLOJK_035754 [Asimina triloba]